MSIPMPILHTPRRGRFPKGFLFIDTVGTIYRVSKVPEFAEALGLSAGSLYRLTAGKSDHVRGMKMFEGDITGRTVYDFPAMESNDD
ncbi:MAG: hypothetical protein ACRC6V_04800 [Bacteroidales bacterium]